MHRIDLWINALNNICFLVQHGYIHGDVVVKEFMKNDILRCWEQLKPYIRYRQNNRLSVTDYKPSLFAKHLEAMIKGMKPEWVKD